MRILLRQGLDNNATPQARGPWMRGVDRAVARVLPFMGVAGGALHGTRARVHQAQSEEAIQFHTGHHTRAHNTLLRRTGAEGPLNCLFKLTFLRVLVRSFQSACNRKNQCNN